MTNQSIVMPGAFTHITAVNKVLSESSFHFQLPSHQRRILSMNQQIFEFGSIAPDFPYMVLRNKAQSQWADCMHTCSVGESLKDMIEYVKTLSGQEFNLAYSWLSGYLAHIIADITIHPVIELKVGPYAKNKQQHRICEMHQDAYIWKYMGIGEIGFKERVSRSLTYCSDTTSFELNKTISNIWRTGLLKQTPENLTEKPDLNLWYQSFKRVIALVEDEYKLFPFSRHVAAFLGLKYPSANEIDKQFVARLPTPIGTLDYDEIFHLCVKQVIIYIDLLWKSIKENHPVDWVKNWNLDTGYSENGEMTIWNELIQDKKF
ncbi:zinc dependent phospholipase C family protein [Vibrio salinus]|uniref:zinc dependent phospholipase C family protein n=1 Tax=Vibrio salinus TaxID=2899784 RepID=UPI001E2DC784|nr:zinc dependent phospholipase C family protein [Vibrio salinus]MCE0492502.1 zinc dependent phospholipase C family protein [Vibrio salinus]